MGRGWRLVISLGQRVKINKMKGIIVLLMLVLLPSVSSQAVIESRVDSLFLASEEIRFNVRVNNLGEENFEGKLLVEVIDDKSSLNLLEEGLNLVSGELYMKSLNDRFAQGDYTIRIELRDNISVVDQKILYFKVISSCNIENVCSIERAHERCDKCLQNNIPEELPEQSNYIILTAIVFGLVLIYFKFKKK